MFPAQGRYAWVALGSPLEPSGPVLTGNSFMLGKARENKARVFILGRFSGALENRVVFMGFHAPENFPARPVFFGCRTFT